MKHLQPFEQFISEAMNPDDDYLRSLNLSLT